MPQCAVCDESLQPEQKTCHVCGSHVAPGATPSVSTAAVGLPSLPMSNNATSSVMTPEPVVNAAGFECPDCGQTFDESYNDDFCPCGSELRHRTSIENLSAKPVISETSTVASPPAPVPNSPESVSSISGSNRPPVGTVCIVVYSDAKPRVPLQYFPIAKDVLVVGRQDAVRGDFPDIDLGSLVEETHSRKISRRHAEVLRARDSQTYSLRPLPGNTGTQVGKELAIAGQTYLLSDGTPIVLGGVVWMKFETIK